MKIFTCAAAVVSATMLATIAYATQDRETAKERLFLMETAQSQQGEIELGKIAIRQAGSTEVRELGERVIADYSNASEKAAQFADAEGVELFKRLTPVHKEKVERLANLSGHEFDKAYVDYMIKDHSREVEDFAEQVKQIRNPTVKQWAEDTISILREQLKRAHQLAASMSREGGE